MTGRPGRAALIAAHRGEVPLPEAGRPQIEDAPRFDAPDEAADPIAADAVSRDVDPGRGRGQFPVGREDTGFALESADAGRISPSAQIRVSSAAVWATISQPGRAR
jgi:hypothetical protein